MKSVYTLVIGAGPTGLGAATRLTEKREIWHLVEASDHPGGAASSYTDSAGFTWDLGGHVIHNHFPSFEQAVKDSKVELLYPERNGWVWMQGKWYETPIQQQLDELPTDLDPDGPLDNLADYYRNFFGWDLAGKFFVPFQEKMWATACRLVDHDWTSHRSGSGAPNVPELALKGTKPKPVREAFPYPKGGTGQLWKGVAAQLDQRRMQYNARVARIDLKNRIAYLEDGSKIAYNQCVSTMPLTRLAKVADIDIASDLRCNEVLVVGIGMNGPIPEFLADKSWVYCPDWDVAWHRVTVLSNYDPGLAGDGRWSLLFEIGTSPWRPVSVNEAFISCMKTVQEWTQYRLPQAAPASVFSSSWQKRVPFGYPVPTLGRDDELRRVDELLIRHGVRSRGRFGGWRYESCNQDHSWEQGREAVDAVDGGQEEVYWHPEHFSG